MGHSPEQPGVGTPRLVLEPSRDSHRLPGTVPGTKIPTHLRAHPRDRAQRPLFTDLTHFLHAHGAIGPRGGGGLAHKLALFLGDVIVAGTGGKVSLGVADALVTGAYEIPVTSASRTRAESAFARTYVFLGSEIDLHHLGLVRSGWPDGRKAGVLLTFLLRKGVRNRAVVTAGINP